MPPRCYANADFAEARFGDLAGRYSAALGETDELGAAALEALDELGSDGLDLFEAALAEGIDSVSGAPEPLRALFSSLEEPSFAVDYDLVDLGARALMRHGFGYAGRSASAGSSRRSTGRSPGITSPRPIPTRSAFLLRSRNACCPFSLGAFEPWRQCGGGCPTPTIG